MTNQTRRGRAQLHDKSAAQGVYEVEYTVHVSTRVVRNIGKPPVTQRTISANVQSVNGYMLKNGRYDLEENGESLYRLEKAGANWHVLS